MNCFALLSETMADFVNQIDDTTIVMRKLIKLNAPADEAQVELNCLLISGLFRHINILPAYQDKTTEDHVARKSQSKMLLLSLVISEFLLYQMKLRPLDDRDSWINKRVKGTGLMMNQLFRSSWKKILQEVHHQANLNLGNALNTVVDKIKRGVITSTFRDSFVTPNWGGVVRSKPTLANSLPETVCFPCLVTSTLST